MAGLLNQQSSRKRMKKFSGKREFRPAQLIKGQINWMVSSPKEGEQTVYKYMEKKRLTFLCIRRIQIQTTLRFIPPHNSFCTGRSACHWD